MSVCASVPVCECVCVCVCVLVCVSGPVPASGVGLRPRELASPGAGSWRDWDPGARHWPN